MKKLILKGKYEFCNNYFADDNGHIWSEYKQDYLTEYEDKNGYKKVVLMTKDKPGKGHRFSVHRLILETFNPVPDMQILQVDHINGDCQDNRLENLRWTTCVENLNNKNTKPNRRVYDQDGTHNASAKFNEETLRNLIQDINSGLYKRKEILKKYDICEKTLRRIVNKLIYKKELAEISINPIFISDMARNTSGESNGRAKLTNEQVLQIIKMLQSKKYTSVQIARIFKVSEQIIGRIKRKETWKHLTKDINFD